MEAHQLPGLTPLAHDGEHAVEIELPFLQRALVGEFLLMPVMVRTHRPDELRALGQALAETLADLPGIDGRQHRPVTFFRTAGCQPPGCCHAGQGGGIFHPKRCWRRKKAEPVLPAG